MTSRGGRGVYVTSRGGRGIQTESHRMSANPGGDP